METLDYKHFLFQMFQEPFVEILNWFHLFMVGFESYIAIFFQTSTFLSALA